MSLAEVRYGRKGWDADIIRKRLLNAHSWLLKSDSFSNDVKDKQQVDALWICNILQWRIIREDIVHSCLFTYLREASAVARSTSLGNVRASKAGRAKSMALTLFLLM